MTSRSLATEAVRSLVRAALRAEGGLEVQGAAIAPGLRDRELLDAVHRQRVVEVLAGNAQALGLRTSVLTELTTARDRRRMQTLVLMRELVRAVTLLGEEGIRCLAFKGPVLAAQTTGDPTGRGHGDIDLWVAPSNLPRAHRALAGGGWRSPDRYPVPGASWAWRHLVRAGCETPLVGDHSTVDLHWHLDPIQGGLPHFEEAWAERAMVTIGDREIPTLSRRHALAHSCAHASKDDWRWLRSLVDIHRLAADPETWRGVARPDHLDRLTRASLAITAQQIGLAPSTPSWLRAEANPAPRRLLQRAERSQDAPFPPGEGFPGVAALRACQRLACSSARPIDLARIFVRLVLPAGLFGAVHDTSATRAVPKALIIRARHFVTRVRRWWRHRG